MRRLLKVLLYLVILVAVLLGGAVAAFLYAPSDTVARFAESRVEEATGRKLTIDGGVERTLYPVLGVKTGAVSFANADWASSGPLMKADGVEIGVRLLPLLSGGVEVENAVLIRPEFQLEIAEDGSKSWELQRVDVDSGAGADIESGIPGGDDGEMNIIVDNFEIRDGRVAITDRRTGGAPVEITDIAMQGALPSLDEALNLTGSAIAQGRPSTLELTLDSPGALQRGEKVQARAALASDGAMGRFDGSFLAAGAAPEGEGDFKLVLSNDKQKTAWIRAFLPPELEPLGAVDLDGSFSSSAEAIVAAAKGAVGFKNAMVTLDAEAKGGADWGRGGPVETRVDAEAGRLFTFSWNGVAAAGTGAVKGDFGFDSPDLRGFFEWAGLGPVDAPAGTFRTLKVKSAIDLSPVKGAVQDLSLQLDDSGLTGSASYDLTGDRPTVAAQLDSGPLDIRPFTRAAEGAGPQGGGGGAPADPPGPGWSTEPLELGALDLVDADIEVRTGGLTTEVLKVGKSHVTLQLKDGVLLTEIKEMALYGGSATGSARIDGSGGTPEVALKVDAADVALRPLLQDSAEMDWLEGTGALTIDVAGRGDSQDAIMRSLGGNAAIDFRDGAIIGYNLAGLVRNITTLGLAEGGEQKTDFAEMKASFDIADGVASNEDFFLAGPLLRLTGSGTVDVGTQTLNYRAIPKAVATLSGQGGSKGLSGIAFPLLITGYWGDPSITPDIRTGALDAVEGLLTSPEDAGALFDALKEGPELGIGGIEAPDLGVGDVLQTPKTGLGDAIEGVLGGGGDSEKKNDSPFGGLLGN